MHTSAATPCDRQHKPSTTGTLPPCIRFRARHNTAARKQCARQRQRDRCCSRRPACAYLPTMFPVCPFLRVSVNLFRLGAWTTDLDSMSAGAQENNTIGPKQQPSRPAVSGATHHAQALMPHTLRRAPTRSFPGPPHGTPMSEHDRRTQVLREARHGCRPRCPHPLLAREARVAAIVINIETVNNILKHYISTLVADSQSQAQPAGGQYVWDWRHLRVYVHW